MLKKALAQSFDTTKAKTVQFSGAVQLKTESGSFSIDLKGSGDNQTGAFDVTTTIDALVTKLTVDTRSVDGKTFYLRVGGLQGLSSLLSSSMADQSVAAYGPMIETLNNQWFEINESLISQFTKGQTIQPLSQADRDKLVAAYQQHTFLVVKQKLADEVVKGTKSYHYKVAIDNVQLKAFFAAVKTANLSSMKLTDEQLQSIDQSIDQAKLDQLDVEVWVAKSTKMLDQVTLSFTEGKSAVNVRLTIDSYNKEVKVEKPADAKSLLEVISGLLTGGTLPTGELPNGISL